MDKKIVFSTNGAGTFGYPHAKMLIYTSPHTIYKNYLKMEYRPKCKLKL